MSTRYIALTTVLLCLLSITPAMAFNPYTGLSPADTYPALGRALPVARAAWPDSPCTGREYVAFKAPDLVEDGQLSYFGDTGDAYALPQGCRVYISTSVLSGYQLCALLVHEFGHLAGQGHSSDPESIMNHDVPGDYAPCLEAR